MTNRNFMTIWNDGRWYPLTELRREMDRLFDDFGSNSNASSTAYGQSNEGTFVPACDVEESKDHYLLTLEVPGVAKENLKIEFMENQLVVTGERRQEKKSDQDGAWYSERRFGKFQRSFTLPAGVDAERIEADYQNGVLRLLVPKAESVKPRQIKINQGSAGFFGKLLGSGKTEKQEELSNSDYRSEKAAS